MCVFWVHFQMKVNEGMDCFWSKPQVAINGTAVFSTCVDIFVIEKLHQLK